MMQIYYVVTFLFLADSATVASSFSSPYMVAWRTLLMEENASSSLVGVTALTPPGV